MKKFLVRSDMEGLFGVVNWEDVIPGTASYERARGWLHQELGALCEGLLQRGAAVVEIYDEHFYGLNVDVSLLPEGVTVWRGKPPYTADWPGGIDSTCGGLILQGYHAMWGTKSAILPHTYEPDIQAIWINGTLVGEIGVEAAIAGDAGIPLILFLGDQHGADEANALAPGLETVVVKTGKGAQSGLCRAWADIRKEIVAKAAEVAANSPATNPFQFTGPVEMIVELGEGKFRERLGQTHPQLFARENHVRISAPSTTKAWAYYWAVKDETLESLKHNGKDS